MIKNQYNIPLKFIKTNNGPEFLLSSLYASKGISNEEYCVETLQQNRKVERKHQHILNVGRILPIQSKLSMPFWSYVVLHAVFLSNRITAPLLQNKYPF